MQLNSKTGPYLLMAGGAALLAGALFSFKLPLLLGGAVFLGLGFWALRRLDLSLFMRGYILLGASAAVIAVAAVFSAAHCCSSSRWPWRGWVSTPSTTAIPTEGDSLRGPSALRRRD